MDEVSKGKRGFVRVLLCLILVLVGVAGFSFVAPISEQTKLLLLGGCLLAVGIWGRRKLKQG
jgi:hypothetical protein